MNDPELRPEACPHCYGPRSPKNAGPGFVEWVCHDCSRVGREESV